jgi:hypothetical protein
MSLVVDRPVGERDPAAEPGGQPPRLKVVLRQGDQLVGTPVGVGGDADGVDPIRYQAAPQEPADESELAQLVVAEHVRHDVPDPPLGAQRWHVPTVRTSA